MLDSLLNPSLITFVVGIGVGILVMLSERTWLRERIRTVEIDRLKTQQELNDTLKENRIITSTLPAEERRAAIQAEAENLCLRKEVEVLQQRVEELSAQEARMQIVEVEKIVQAPPPEVETEEEPHPAAEEVESPQYIRRQPVQTGETREGGVVVSKGYRAPDPVFPIENTKF